MQVGKAAASVAAVLVATAIGCGGQDPNPRVEPDPAFGAQPNFVFVLTDDQDFASYNRRTMPNTFRLLGRRGATFANHYDATPLCCPSRAAMLTGQYGHNNGVLNNKPGYGDLDDPGNVLPVWLQRAGYRTAYVGKFLNGYEQTADDKDDVAPGWDLWSVLVGNARGYNDFMLTVDGRERKELYHGGAYLTDVLNERAARYVHELAGAQPFFLQVGQAAPHVENLNADSGGPCGGFAVPAPRDQGSFADAPLPRLPAVRERDVSDKPAIVSEQPPLGPRRRRALEHQYRCRLETLPAVDRGIAELVEALRETGELADTVIVFASDNGTFHGQHRLPGGKGLAYEEAARVPMVIRAPAPLRGDAPAAGRIQAPTANIDLVPTLVDWAGTETCPPAGECRVMDGRSLLPLLAGREERWPARRPVLTELDVGKDAVQSGRGISCSYQGVREGRWLYIRHSSLPDLATGSCEEVEEVELYDRARDPFELQNLAATGARAGAVSARLATLTDELADCAGIEGRDPEPESGHYCR
jgi:N-acetylglucosamine-6-sulfatase